MTDDDRVRTAAEKQAAIALGLITGAFADRQRPTVMSDSLQLSDVEYAEVMSFQGLRWQDVAFPQVVACADAVFWFAPAAFCYYLPGFMAASMRENQLDSNAYDALIGTLDRSPEPDYWDDFFLPRWPLLSLAEIRAVAAWVRWLAIVEPEQIGGHGYDRVQDTLTLLERRAEEANRQP